MNFFNRAIKNVTRKLSKTILLIITFLMIGNFVIIGLSVANASESAKRLTRQKMRAVATYTIDYDKYWRDGDAIEDENEREEFYKKYPQITLKDVNEIIKDERVKTANAQSNYQFYTAEGGIDFVHLNNTAEQNIEEWGGKQCYFDWVTNEQICETYKEPSFFVKGNFFPSMIEFEDGGFEIVEGRFYSQEDIDNSNMVVVVSKALADTNYLKVGDKVKFQTENLGRYYQDMGITEEDLIAEFEVVGIYTHNVAITPDSSNYDYTYPYENPDNILFAPGTTLYNISLPIQQKSWDYYSSQYPDEEYYSNPDNRPTATSIENVQLYDVTILLNDPLEVDGFVKEYKNKVGDYKKITVDNSEFNRLSKPLDTLSNYATFIVWLVVCNAIVIITLVTALTLKTREYEIGVLLSIGASKFKVIMQFFVELAIVAIIGFTLSVGTGSIIAKKIGMSLLENQIQSSGINEEETDDYYWNDGAYNPWDTNYNTEISLEDIVAEYDVTVSPVIIGEIYLMGLGIVMISVIIPSFMIMRYNPKKILMNQY